MNPIQSALQTPVLRTYTYPLVNNQPGVNIHSNSKPANHAVGWRAVKRDPLLLLRWLTGGCADPKVEVRGLAVDVCSSDQH